ncbi:Protein CBG04662 [Caenorhabditis briggsae]|uniref:Protein CBG04662 n=1 Tax=Caenorhabditis briggsae TaxID=6238 RepID=A8WY66_CAEBR|nr:Protein CBG04662 [Caenorhabditis briggsae]CAP25324.1 Protein CBG04662 [Caenorhabditis briggsae]
MASKENSMDTGDDVDAQQKEIRAMKRKFDEMSEKLQSVEESFSKISKNETSAISKQAPIEKSINSNVTSNQEKMAAESGKRFVVKEVFTDIAEFEEKQTNCSEDEEHFNMKWCIKLDRDGNNLGLFIYCTPIDYDKNWSIQTEILFKFVGSNGKVLVKTKEYCFDEKGETGFSDFMNWEDMEKEYLVDGNLTAEIHVQIIESTGLGKEKIRTFDESNKDCSDVVLAVRDTKFYVLKKFLAVQSSFFKSLLLGNFSESLESEVRLTGIDPHDFHYFLEVLYGESAIDDSTVEGVFLLADMYDAPTKFAIQSSESQKKFEKKFVLKHVFKNVATLGDEDEAESEKEEHFGRFWHMSLGRGGDYLGFFIDFSNPISTEQKWSIETEIEFRVVDQKQDDDFVRTVDQCLEACPGYGGLRRFMRWETMEKKYLMDGNLSVEVHVTIKKSTGLGKEKIRKFDVSQRDVSDVVLTVRDTKFYANKMYLAAQSPFFKDLLCGTFSSESDKSQITLTGIDPHDFHYFLEVLYGESAIDDNNVEGVLLLAVKYDASTAIRRCEEFLLEKSKKTLKKKLMMAVRYELENLKKICMDQIVKKEQIKSVIPSNIEDLDLEVMRKLLEKSLSFR